MSKIGDMGITVRGVRYSVIVAIRARNSLFNGPDCWWVSKKRPRYFSAGVALWRIALEFCAIERKEAP